MHAPARASEAGLNSVFAALYNSARCGRQEWRLTRKSYSLQLALQVAQSVESRDTRSAKVRCAAVALPLLLGTLANAAAGPPYCRRSCGQVLYPLR